MTTISTPIPEISPQNRELLREVQPLLDKITVLVNQLSPLHQLYLLQLIIQSLMQSLNHQPAIMPPANTSQIDALAEMATLA